MRIGSEHREVHAREAKGEERDRLYEKATKLYPPYRQYQERTERKIPVIVLEPRTEGTPAAADAPSAEARAYRTARLASPRPCAWRHSAPPPRRARRTRPAAAACRWRGSPPSTRRRTRFVR